MDNQDIPGQNQTTPEPNTQPPQHAPQQVVVSHFTEGVPAGHKLIPKLKPLTLVALLVVVLASVTGGVYAFSGHKPKSSVALSSTQKAQSTSASKTSSDTSAQAPAAASNTTNKAATPPASTTTSKLPTSTSVTSIPDPTPVSNLPFGATANAPHITDNGSYAPTQTNAGQCVYNDILSWSVNGPGSIHLKEYDSTNSPGNGPNSFDDVQPSTYTHATSDSFNASSSTIISPYDVKPLIVSVYFQVINDANGQVLATSPTSTLSCP